mmetsp:Transcript_40574/g.125338  ORF Transcript_40574/g.125338 Transcript_40574/m.125338 type:complete len:280 (+) Transcript_40574:427-1266(+)
MVGCRAHRFCRPRLPVSRGAGGLAGAVHSRGRGPAAAPRRGRRAAPAVAHGRPSTRGNRSPPLLPSRRWRRGFDHDARRAPHGHRRAVCRGWSRGLRRCCRRRRVCFCVPYSHRGRRRRGGRAISSAAGRAPRPPVRAERRHSANRRGSRAWRRDSGLGALRGRPSANREPRGGRLPCVGARRRAAGAARGADCGTRGAPERERGRAHRRCDRHRGGGPCVQRGDVPVGSPRRARSRVVSRARRRPAGGAAGDRRQAKLCVADRGARRHAGQRMFRHAR